MAGQPSGVEVGIHPAAGQAFSGRERQLRFLEVVRIAEFLTGM
jgi:hypothetical protein